MYYLKKKMEVAGAHHLNLDYSSKCSNIHGHNWVVTIYCKSEILDKNGMIVDFTSIKNIVNQLDHQNINNVVGMNPTAENLARWLCEQIPYCYRIDISETENNEASYVLEV
jgi:6-pyruvoyltetrahydropterin/6-carboxytetrahydropterin synthase